MDLSQLWTLTTNFVVENREDLRNWATVIIPAIGIVSAWRLGRRKAMNDEITRQRDEQRLIHTENAEQTTAMTDQFRAIMEGYKSRVEDLGHEVSVLRTEVTSLRKTLDRQRVVCANCPKLPLLLQDTLNAATAAPN